MAKGRPRRKATARKRKAAKTVASKPRVRRMTAAKTPVSTPAEPNARSGKSRPAAERASAGRRESAAKPPSPPARKRYTRAQRARILSAAERDKLTAIGVQKRFGVKPGTYYLWRRKAKGAGRRSGGSSSADRVLREVRLQLQARIRKLLPEIVLSEVRAWLDEAMRG
jgi:transposase-like protein